MTTIAELTVQVFNDPTYTDEYIKVIGAFYGEETALSTDMFQSQELGKGYFQAFVDGSGLFIEVDASGDEHFYLFHDKDAWENFLNSEYNHKAFSWQLFTPRSIAHDTTKH